MKAADPASVLVDNPAVPPDQRSRTRKLLEQGVTVYNEVLEFLAPYIFPDEASAAEKATLRAISILCGTAVGLALLACLPSSIPFKDDLLAAAGLVSALALVSRWRVFFAARLLLLPIALLTFHTPSYSTWNPIDDAWESLDVLFAALVLACLIDYGASTEPERRRRRLRKLSLLLAGAGILVAAWKHGFLITSAASLFACVWGWWPASQLERRSRLPADDADILWVLAMRRWWFVAWGRILATAAALIPFFLFLHSLGLEDRLQLPKNDPELITTKLEGMTHAWFWQPRGFYLRASDLRRELFYGLQHGGWEEVESLRSELADANRGEEGREPEVIYGEIKAKLAPHRILNAEGFRALREGTGFIKLYHLEEPGPGQRSKARKLRGLTFIVEDLTMEIGSPLVPVNAGQVQSLIWHNDIWQWLLLGYGLLGFVILWRRGGDSRLGRWIGLWFIAVGTLGMTRYVDFFLPALNYQVSHQSDLPTETLINLMVLVALVIVGLFFLFVICGAVWTHACWPSARPDGPRRWLRKIRMACKISLVSAGMALLFYLPWLAFSNDPSMAAFCGIALFPGVAFGMGTLLRKRAAVRNSRPPISLSAGFVLLVVQAVVVTTVFVESFTEDVSPELVDSLKRSSLLCGFVFLAFIAILIFKKDFLHLSAVRDFSLVITAMVVPVMLAWSEELSSSYISLFAENLISTRGKEILAVVLALGLLPPLRRLIERQLLYATQPRLRGMERSVQETLEDLFDLRDPESFDRIEGLLRKIGLGGLMLYVREGKDSFRAVRSLPEGKPNRLEVSPSLRRFLTANRGFLDLRRLAFEWRYFFVQFELHRIRKATDGRFLLPVCLGGSARALLLVPEGARSIRLGESLAGEIAQLGLIAAELRDEKEEMPTQAGSLTIV